jgi:hydrogenase expression/formation protein HypC
MCVAVPGKIVDIENDLGKVDFLGAIRNISLDLIDDVEIGDYIIAHAGYAVEKIKEEEAIETIKLFEELREIGQGF